MEDDKWDDIAHLVAFAITGFVSLYLISLPFQMASRYEHEKFMESTKGPYTDAIIGVPLSTKNSQGDPIRGILTGKSNGEYNFNNAITIKELDGKITLANSSFRKDIPKNNIESIINAAISQKDTIQLIGKQKQNHFNYVKVNTKDYRIEIPPHPKEKISVQRNYLPRSYIIKK